MKTFLSLSVSLLLASPLFAQSPEPATDSELSKLRQSYVDSLHRLLQQDIKAGNVVAAVAVSRELDRMAGAAPSLPVDSSPCGTWEWPGGDPITITADGITTHAVWNTRGIWRWIDESKHQFQIEWQDGFIDRATISPDGLKLQLVNNADRKFTADRALLPGKAVVRATAE